MKPSVFVLALAFVLIGAASACTVGANVGDVGPASADAEVTEAASDGDSGTGTGSDAGCNITFPQEATFIDVQVQPGVPPSYAGGDILPGVYVLTGMTVYVGRATGTAQIRETLRVSGTAAAGTFERFSEAQNASGSFAPYAPHGESSRWRVLGGSLFNEALQCPTQGVEHLGQFNAQGATLSMLDTDKFSARTYRRLR